MSYCIVENDEIVNIAEASAEYAAAKGWIANQGWAIGWLRSGNGFAAPELSEPNASVPAEVPRWAGVLALKRHALVGAELVLLTPDADGSNSLFSVVLAFWEAMPAGESKDRMDVALNIAKDWLRVSPTVATMVAMLGLTATDADVLFVWANAQLGTV